MSIVFGILSLVLFCGLFLFLFSVYTYHRDFWKHEYYELVYKTLDAFNKETTTTSNEDDFKNMKFAKIIEVGKDLVHYKLQDGSHTMRLSTFKFFYNPIDCNVKEKIAKNRLETT